VEKKRFYFLLSLEILFFFSLYLFFLFSRPYELDESLYILSGKMIILNQMNPISPSYENPFTYIFGSPFAPILYGLFFFVGGFFISRIVSLISVISSLIVLSKIVKDFFGKRYVHLAVFLSGISASAILLASNALLDSLAILFLILSFYFIYAKRNYLAGIFMGIAILFKFFLFLPSLLILLYLLRKKDLKFLYGLFLIIFPYFISNYPVLFQVLRFLISRPNFQSVEFNFAQMLREIWCSFPVSIYVCTLFLKEKIVRDNLILLIPAISLFLFHFLSLNYVSVPRHMSYAIFSSSILASVLIQKYEKYKFFPVFLLIFLLLLSYLNLNQAISAINSMPSYEFVENEIREIEGNILAINPYIVHLLKGSDLRDKRIKSFFEVGCYEREGLYSAIVNSSMFDYAIISSKPYFLECEKLQELVRKSFCPFKVINSTKNVIEIYYNCNFSSKFKNF